MTKHAWLFAVLLLPLTATARDCAPQVKDGWIRLLPGGMPMQAGFGRIENRCAMPATLVSASSAAYASVELHESRVVDGVNRMRAVPELRIAPEGAAVLQPGGLHLMLMRPLRPLAEGDVARLRLVLADGRRVFAEFPVRRAAP